MTEAERPNDLMTALVKGIKSSNALIVPEKGFEQPGDTDRLWRFMSLEQLLDLIVHHTLFIPCVTTFDDAHECWWPERLQETLRDSGLWRDLKLRDKWIRWRARSYASCWCCCEKEPAHMWARDGRYDVAVVSSLARMQDGLRSGSRIISCGLVRYGHDTGDCDGLIAPSFFKREQFKGENEFRLVTAQLQDLEKEPPEGIVLLAEAASLFDHVVIGPRMSSYRTRLLQSIMMAAQIPVRETLRVSDVRSIPKFIDEPSDPASFDQFLDSNQMPREMVWVQKIG